MSRSRTRARERMRRAGLVGMVVAGCASNTVGVGDEGTTDAATGETSSAQVTASDAGWGETDGTSSTGSSGADDPDSTTTSVGCADSADCHDPAAPICEAGRCVGCQLTAEPQAACADRDPSMPLCLDDGSCAACPADAVCPAVAPACGCTACVSHDECPGGAACGFDDGECLSGAVVYVDDQPACPGTGTEQDPFCSIQDAIDLVGDGGMGTIRVAPHDGAGYVEGVQTLPNQVIGILGNGGLAVVSAPAEGATSVLSVPDDSTSVYVARVVLRGSTMAPALSLEGGHLDMQASRLSQNPGGSLYVGPGASAYVDNSMIATTTYTGGRGIDVDGGQVVVSYTSLVIGAIDPTIVCTPGSTVEIRDSIVLNMWSGNELDCEIFVFEANVTTAEVGQPPYDFIWFENQFAGDLHLRPEGAAVFADYAQWNAGDPATDIDGDPRPRVDGTPDFPGADVPVAR